MTEQELMKRYPKLFKQKDLPMTHTAMCWGIECGEGWFPLLESLCHMLQHLTDNEGHPQVEFTQIKEKFGTLRVYTQGASDIQFALINFVEDLSGKICSNCGCPAETKESDTGWVSTLCEKCEGR